MFLNRRTGRITVAQWPNLSLAVFIVLAAVARILHPVGGPATALRGLTVAVIGVWALDEIFRGVNPFRRILGAAVLLGTVVNLVVH